MKKVFFIILILACLVGCSNKQKGSKDGKPLIFVSILPQKYFVEKIVGDDFKIEVMVRPGFSPATYEPLPSQMIKLSKAKIYFSIGVPFEKTWINKIKNNYPKLKIIDTKKGIVLRKMDSFAELGAHFHEAKDHDHEEEHSHEKPSHTRMHHQHEHDGDDPHIWLSPTLVETQAENMYQALILQNPDRKNQYNKNFLAFKNELANLSADIKKRFKDKQLQSFLVFHPSWGYLADELGLKQIPLEVQGKSPTSKELARIINYAKSKKIKVIFVQEQFSRKEALTIAKAIKGKVISLNPLAYDYIKNLRKIVDALEKEVK